MPKIVYSLFNDVTISDNQFSSTFSGLLMLQLLVPILIGCLLDPAQMKQANPLTKNLACPCFNDIDADRYPVSTGKF